ncbi:MAG: hypothetical protein QNJ37_23845 [Crocosphaera sp.]|nr:hypothetical protein [Crocosphaera sp.]
MALKLLNSFAVETFCKRLYDTFRAGSGDDILNTNMVTSMRNFFRDTKIDSIAIKDGYFFDSKTWHNELIPAKKARVFIPQERKVYYRASDCSKYDRLNISLEQGSKEPILLGKTNTNINIKQKCVKYVKENKIEGLIIGGVMMKQ